MNVRMNPYGGYEVQCPACGAWAGIAGAQSLVEVQQRADKALDYHEERDHARYDHES